MQVPAMLCTAAAICLLQDQKEEPEFSEDEVETLQALFRTKLDAITSSQSADLLLLGKHPGHFPPLLVEAVSLILSWSYLSRKHSKNTTKLSDMTPLPA
jgi:hypothetical protein